MRLDSEVVRSEEWGNPLFIVCFTSFKGENNMRAEQKEIENQVKALLEPLLKRMGLLLWDLEYKKEGADFVLRVFLEKEKGAIGLDALEDASKFLSARLDETDLIPGAFLLETSSPGVERKLSEPWHFDWAKGKKITIKKKTAQNGEKKITGELLSRGEEGVLLRTERGEENILLSEIESAKLYFDF